MGYNVILHTNANKSEVFEGRKVLRCVAARGLGGYMHIMHAFIPYLYILFVFPYLKYFFHIKSVLRVICL